MAPETLINWVAAERNNPILPQLHIPTGLCMFIFNEIWKQIKVKINLQIQVKALQATIFQKHKPQYESTNTYRKKICMYRKAACAQFHLKW